MAVSREVESISGVQGRTSEAEEISNAKRMKSIVA
jgi:hypothetical protein